MLNETLLLVAGVISLLTVCAGLALLFIKYLTDLCTEKLINSGKYEVQRTRKLKRSS